MFLEMPKGFTIPKGDRVREKSGEVVATMKFLCLGYARTRVTKKMALQLSSLVLNNITIVKDVK